MVLLQPYFHSSSINQLLTLWSLFKCKPLPLKSLIILLLLGDRSSLFGASGMGRRFLHYWG